MLGLACPLAPGGIGEAGGPGDWWGETKRAPRKLSNMRHRDSLWPPALWKSMSRVLAARRLRSPGARAERGTPGGLACGLLGPRRPEAHIKGRPGNSCAFPQLPAFPACPPPPPPPPAPAPPPGPGPGPRGRPAHRAGWHGAGRRAGAPAGVSGPGGASARLGLVQAEFRARVGRREA